jgi:CheY-like chemotaxis protein
VYSSKGKKMAHNILVVDDDPSVLYTVKKVLESSGLSVETADNGQACINKLEQGFKGLILMDIVMPNMDGWDTIREIIDRGLYKDIIICMLTGQDMPSEKMNPFKEYIMDYIRKPFDYANFVEIIRQYLSYLE